MSSSWPVIASREDPREKPMGSMTPQARLDRWLLESAVQRSDGAVAGWIDTDGAAAYVYPEITGYYLQWLAWRARESGDGTALASRAAAAQRWLRTWMDLGEAPPTRVYADAAQRDWRNRALFTFDLAMVLRGLASSAHHGLLAPDAALVDKVGKLLESLIGDDGELDAVRVHTPDAEFPRRWSTERGPFLAKAAAGLLHASEILPAAVPMRVREAASRTFSTSLRALRERPHSQTHPLLYAIEGYLSAPAHPEFAANLPWAVERFERLIGQSIEFGRVPEAVDDPGQPRLDIVAQTLRVGVLLEHHARIRIGPFLRPLERELEAAITREGAVPFVAGAAPIQRNAWATMFASQALAWTSLDQDATAQVATAPLIV